LKEASNFQALTNMIRGIFDRKSFFLETNEVEVFQESIFSGSSREKLFMQEVQLFPLWVSVFLAIWGVVGPTIGVLAGHYLSASSERKRWIADNQKEEYRRLLAALSKINIALCELRTSDGTMEALSEGLSDFSEASNTCLFINEFLESSGVLGEIRQAAQAFVETSDFEDYRKKYWNSINQIIESVKKIRA
jgi:hypothetical protein